MIKVNRYRMLKLLDSIANNTILADNVDMMEKLGPLNQEVAFMLKTLGLKSIEDVREELKNYEI